MSYTWDDSKGPGVLISSRRLGVDVWLIKDPAFKPGDGLAWYFPEELPLLDQMDDEELRKVQEVKLAFPGSHVRDFKLKEEKMDTERRMPPLPFTVYYKQEQIDEILKAWAEKYPAENARAWTAEEAEELGFDNNDEHGMIGEDAIERFCSQTSLRSMKVNSKPGPDRVDRIVEGWRVDVKTITAKSHWRGNNFRLRVAQWQVEKEKSPINAYWFALFNSEALTCELYGWRPRKDFALVKDGGLAILRPKGSPVAPGRGGWIKAQHDLGADQMFSEQEFFHKKAP